MTERTETRHLNLGALSPVTERKSLGEYVCDRLKQAIIRGDLPAGEWLVESWVAETMGISRTPVREALHKLEREGLLRKVPRGGFTVLGLSREDIEETFGIREILESHAARLAARKHSEKDLKPLEKKIEQFQKHLERGELEALLRINTEFHDLLYSLSRSPKLIRMIQGLQDQIYRFRKIILQTREMAEVSNQDHRQMLELIRVRDGEGVERVVREHIARGREIILRQFDRDREDLKVRGWEDEKVRG